jgi:hypothetical protein
VYASRASETTKEGVLTTKIISDYLDIKSADEQGRQSAVAELFKLLSIGHIFRSILHHYDNLEYLWILYSKGDAGSELCKKLAIEFTKKNKRQITAVEIPVIDPDSVSEIGSLIQTKIKETWPALGLKASDVSFNITTGNSISSSAMVLQNNLFATPYVLEYITQGAKGTKKLIEVNLIERK